MIRSTSRQRRQTRTCPVLAVLVGVLSLSGCSLEPSTPQPAVTSVDRKAEQAAGELAQVRIAECMRERGFVVGRDAEGREFFDIPPGPDGESKLLDSLAECHGLQVLPSQVPASEEELDGLYDLELTRVECLREQGYEPPPIPSRESYVAERKAVSEGRAMVRWDPLDPQALRSQGHDPQELDRACPAPRLADL